MSEKIQNVSVFLTNGVNLELRETRESFKLKIEAAYKNSSPFVEVQTGYYVESNVDTKDVKWNKCIMLSAIQSF